MYIINVFLQMFFTEEINQVRVVTSVTTSLNCDDYTDNELGALLLEAQKSIAEHVLTILDGIPDEQRIGLEINAVGIR